MKKVLFFSLVVFCAHLSNANCSEAAQEATKKIAQVVTAVTTATQIVESAQEEVEKVEEEVQNVQEVLPTE